MSRAAEIGFCALVLAAICGCGGGASEPPPPPPGAIPAGRSIGTAVLSGRALFKGAPPARRPIVNPDGTLRNVFVHVVAGLGDRVFAPPPQPAEMDQAGCVFVPHLLAVQADQVIVFKNSDAAVHNVHAKGAANPPFNISMSGQGRTARRYFSRPEMVRIRCDIHAWMGAFIAVDGGPFHAVTADAGSFSLAGLPAGTFTVEAWHETLGSARQTITLVEGEHREIEFSFAP